MEPPLPQPPKTTTGTTPEYRHRLADISSRACLSDPLNMLFQRDATGSSAPILVSNLYASTLARINTKLSHGSFIVEADDFAAVACWEPPTAVQDNHSAAELGELQFIQEIEDAKKACLGERKCWLLSLMARDPGMISKGAVRAVIEPFVERARTHGVPVWLVAGNERARDVYAYFGFVVVKVVYSGEERIPTWCMVFNL
ncbi:Puromycin N-acetyltransferase [Lachnellula suecica]|uniref:Puromycin N-acetyltransferase n=1 Tax=Lachnellula suecica TaxID=602035 RepID=A0A8T9BZI2_9HELO|nr:Puromycin N-acetyltransferase [Lachnellula suecica]